MKLHTVLDGKLYQRGEFHKFDKAKKIVALHDANIGLVISCCGRKDPDLAGHVDHVYSPFADGRYVPVPQLHRIVDRAVFTIEKEGQAVLTHCRAGRNRSALVNALIVRDILGVDGPTAMDLVRLARPNSLANPHFESYLSRLDAP